MNSRHLSHTKDVILLSEDSKIAVTKLLVFRKVTNRSIMDSSIL